MAECSTGLASDRHRLVAYAIGIPTCAGTIAMWGFVEVVLRLGGSRTPASWLHGIGLVDFVGHRCEPWPGKMRISMTEGEGTSAEIWVVVVMIVVMIVVMMVMD